MIILGFVYFSIIKNIDGWIEAVFYEIIIVDIPFIALVVVAFMNEVMK